MINIEELNRLYFSNDEPTPYTLKCGVEILIHPILVAQYQIYEICKNILTLPKNEIGIEFLQMSYLEFLITLCKADETYQKQLVNLLLLTLKEDLFQFSICDKKAYITVLDKDENVKYIIDKREFDDISKIILYQNDVDYDDRYINPEVRQAIADYYNLKYKHANSPNFEKQRAFVISKGISVSEVKNMTYRTFSQVYQASVDSEIYMAQKIIQASEKYDVKEDVIHPLYEKKKDRIAEAFTSKDAYDEKLGGVV